MPFSMICLAVYTSGTLRDLFYSMGYKLLLTLLIMILTLSLTQLVGISSNSPFDMSLKFFELSNLLHNKMVQVFLVS